MITLRRLPLTVSLGRVFFLVLAVLSLPAEVGAQAPDNKGTEFFLAFPQNLNVPDLPVQRATHRLTVFLAAEEATTVEISGPEVATQTFAIAASSVLELVYSSAVPQTSTVNAVGNEGIRVRSVDPFDETKEGAPIAVYGMNRRLGSAGAYVAFPVDVLGMEYRALSRPGISPGSPGSQVTVVGTEDNTTVTITTPVAVPGVSSAGVPFVRVLNRLQTFLLQLPAGDLTGTLVMADKPVAVFGGNQFGTVPGPGGSADYMVEQMPPARTWSTEFVVAPIVPRTAGDIVRVLGHENDTTVTINGEVTAVLGAGQFYEFTQPSASGGWITTSKPAQVAQYNKGQDAVQTDPFMMLVPPVDQFSRQYLFKAPVAPFSPPTGSNRLALVVKDGDEVGLLLDNAPLPVSTTWTPVSDSGYKYARLTILSGTHQVGHALPTVRFGAWVYGHAFAEGYGYAAGQLVNTPPACSVATPSMPLIWPPNHTLVPIGVDGVSDHDGDDVTINIASIFQDEPTNGGGDGDTDIDGFGVGTTVAEVRAERSGGGNGRIYHIGFTATDTWGANCSGEITVAVPHNQKRAPVDDGALYDSTAF